MMGSAQDLRSDAARAHDLRSDAARAQGLGAAGHGSGHFWLQRVSAVANIPLVLALLIACFVHRDAARAEWLALFRSPFFALLTMVAIGNICWHMRLGLQVVIEDYVHTGWRKGAGLMANDFAAALIAVGGLWAVLRLFLGG